MAYDYFLLYLDEKGEKHAAVPDVEGVYHNSMPFSEFREKMMKNEVVILEVENLHTALQKEDEEYITCQYVGKFVGSQNIVDCITECGFEEFFTSIIKEYLNQEDPLPEVE